MWWVDEWCVPKSLDIGSDISHWHEWHPCPFSRLKSFRQRSQATQRCRPWRRRPAGPTFSARFFNTNFQKVKLYFVSPALDMVQISNLHFVSKANVISWKFSCFLECSVLFYDHGLQYWGGRMGCEVRLSWLLSRKRNTLKRKSSHGTPNLSNRSRSNHWIITES